jgi:hypothetical protein
LGTIFYIWIIIWTIISGFVGYTIKFIFEKIIPAWQIKKGTRVAIEKYRLPLLQYGTAIKDSMIQIVNSQTKYNDWDAFLRLKTLYFMAAFLGWCQIFAKESLIEYVEHGLSVSKDVRVFNAHYHNVFRGISSTHYFSSSEETFKEAYTSSVPALVATAIGDVMIKDCQGYKSAFPQVIGFREFQFNYENNPEFNKWIAHIDNILNYESKSENDLKWNRIIIFYTHLCVFTYFLERRNKKIYLKMCDYIKKTVKRAHKARVLIYLDRICENIRPITKVVLKNELADMGYSMTYK